MQVTCGTLGLSTSTVKLLSSDGRTHVACSVGTGPVDSAYKAIDLIVKVWNCIFSLLFVRLLSLDTLNHINNIFGLLLPKNL